MSAQTSFMTQQDSNGALQRSEPVPSRYARFGAFLADFERAELYENGQRVKVQAKLFQGLLLLLTRAGDVVTREEVRRHLWPETSLTNLDANVNTTINKLRQVLGDSPESPLYIETIPRRGYSFVASVEFSNAPVEATAAIGRKDLRSLPQANERALWSKERLYLVTRAVSLLFGGMILGALLTFVWFFSQTKYRRTSTDASTRHSVAKFEFQGPTRLSRFNPQT